METKGKTIFGSTLKVDVTSAPAAIDAISTGCQSPNEALKAKYDEMHKQGPSAWFNDGKEERELILKMGEPWGGLRVLEIGCGEGELTYAIHNAGASIAAGIDYSVVAIEKARKRQGRLAVPPFMLGNWDDLVGHTYDRIVMQGVLEHFDDPWGDLDRIIEKFKPKSIITSSPCFLNPRGIVWMTLHMLGAVMSKTDLHYLNPWEFLAWCDKRGYKLEHYTCDRAWSHGNSLIPDFSQRLPLALRDGGIPYRGERLIEFLAWLESATSWMPYIGTVGATMIYRIDL